MSNFARTVLSRLGGLLAVLAAFLGTGLAPGGLALPWLITSLAASKTDHPAGLFSSS